MCVDVSPITSKNVCPGFMGIGVPSKFVITSGWLISVRTQKAGIASPLRNTNAFPEFDQIDMEYLILLFVLVHERVRHEQHDHIVGGHLPPVQIIC